MAIDLIGRKAQLELWADKSAGIKSFHEYKGKWTSVKKDTLLDFKLIDLLNGSIRVISELRLNENIFYIVTNKEDERVLRSKYPKATVINIIQLVDICKKPLEEMGESGFFQILTCLSVFDGARVIS